MNTKATVADLPRHSVLEWVLRWVVILVLAIGFTAYCVSISKKIGRLSSVPNYDDSSYFLAATVRNYAYHHQGGFSGVWKSMRQEYQLHSPYSEFLALAAFAILGAKDESPYWANIIVVLCYLTALLWLSRKLPFFLWLASSLVFLSLPILKMGVAEFRPDIFWGMCCGFGAIYVLTAQNLLRGRWEPFYAGLLFAAAYLAKPSTFPMTTVILVASMGARLFHTWIFREERWRILLANASRALAIGACTLLVFTGWYYIFFGKYIWDYFYENSFGSNKSTWELVLDPASSFLFYLSGAGAQNNLGKLGYYVISFVGILVVIRLAIASWSEKVRCLLLFGICFLVYAINTASGMKTEFLGASFYMLVIFTSAYLISCSYIQFGRSLRAVLSVTLVTLVCVAAFRFPDWPLYSDWSKCYPTLRYTYREATEALTNLLGSIKVSPKAILFVQTGPVVAEDVKIRMLRQYRDFKVLEGSYCHTLSEFQIQKKDADIIVTPYPGTKGITPNLPVTKILPDLLKELESDSEFYLYRSFRLSDGGRVDVYIRKAMEV